MESIGEKLRLAREKNNFTIEQVARDTHVAKRFLKALEDEDFSVFPGETYAMGFLRNYAEYLGLNAEELVTLYKNLKIQEQPLPMSELLEAGSRVNLRLIVIIAAAALVVLGGGSLLLFKLLGSRTPGARTESMQTRQSQDFVFQEEVRTKWFAQGDGIEIPFGDKTYRLVVASIGNTLTLKVPGGTLELTLAKERMIDLDGDSRPDIKVVWNDSDKTSSAARASLGLYRLGGTIASIDAAGADVGSTAGQLPTQTPAGAQAQAGTQAAQTSGAAAAASPSPAPQTPAAAAPPVRAAAFKSAAVSSQAEAAPFTVDLVFRDYCLFRFKSDAKDMEERFFQKGESFSLDARNALTLWMSNTGAVKAKIAGKDVELGRLGEVSTRQIAWRKDSASNSYVLEVTALY
jgi:cytoskeleton protein RodZ